MLPNFLIIGAEKAATTWLARCLAEHPSIYMPREKELFFFSSRMERGLPWYEAYFKDWSGERWLGEATPVYLSHLAAPTRIRSTLGEIKLLISLRHPVDRAYSAFWHNLRRGRLTPASDFRACFQADDWEIRSRGDYLLHLRRYLECFPREFLLVLRYEDIRDDNERAFHDALRFLDVSPFTPRSLNARLNEGGQDLRTLNQPARAMRTRLRSAVLWGMQRRLLPRSLENRVIPAAQRGFERLAHGWGPRARAYEPLPDQLRLELFDAHYREQLMPLQDLLGMDLSRWLETRSGERRGPGPG